MDIFTECLNELIAWISVCINGKTQRPDSILAARQFGELMLISIRNHPSHIYCLFQTFIKCIDINKLNDEKLIALQSALIDTRNINKITSSETTVILNRLKNAGFDL